MFKLVLEKAEEPEIKLPTSAGSWKKQEFQKNIYFCSIDYVKAFDSVDHNKLPDHLSASWEICMQVKKQLLEMAWHNRLDANQERSTSRLYIDTLLI